MMRSLAISVLSALSLVLCAAPLQAQGDSPNPEEVRTAARDAYARGQSLYREGEHAEAEEAFMEAYTMIPNPVVLLGVAEAREAQGNLTGTVQALETYLAEREDAPDRASVQQRIDVIRAKPATLVISSRPAGATIVLDGEDTGEVTPAEIEVEPGPHVVALRLEGRESAEAQVDAIFASSPQIDLELADAVPDGETMDGDGTAVPGADIDDLEANEDDDSGPGTAVWVLSGVAAASLVTGTVLGFLALTQESEFDEMPTEGTADKGERFALFADLAFGLAAVTAISAIVVFATADDDDDEEANETTARVWPVASPTGAGLVGEVTF